MKNSFKMQHSNGIATTGASIPASGNNMVSDFFPLFQPPEENGIKCYKQIIPVTIYHYYIVDEIADVGPYLELINTLKTAEAHDTVFISLNTPGGNLYTTIQIISAIKQSNATVVTCLEGEVCSAGTMLFLSGHKHIVNPYSTFMIHNATAGAGGKWNDVTPQYHYTNKYIENLFNNVYAGFLTPEEITDVLRGKDIWLDSEGVLKRMTPMPEEPAEITAEQLINRAVTEVLNEKQKQVQAAPPAPKPTRKSRSKKK